jgi:alcohol dehydrogenase
MPFADATTAKVPDGLADEQVLLVGDVLSTGLHGVITGGVQPGHVVAVLGAGPVGLCAAHAATLYSPSRIVVTDLEPARRELALRLGADDAIDAGAPDVVGDVLGATGGAQPDVVIEAAGSQATLLQAAELVRPGGRIAMIGNPGDARELPLIDLFNKAATLTGGLARLDRMAQLVALIAAGRLDVLPLVTHRRPLAEIEDAFELFERREDGVVKVAVRV